MPGVLPVTHKSLHNSLKLPWVYFLSYLYSEVFWQHGTKFYCKPGHLPSELSDPSDFYQRPSNSREGQCKCTPTFCCRWFLSGALFLATAKAAEFWQAAYSCELQTSMVKLFIVRSKQNVTYERFLIRATIKVLSANLEPRNQVDQAPSG